MATLYVRDVPDEVAETLKRRAAAQGTSLSAYVATELVKLGARPSNDEVVARLRRLDRSAAPSSLEIVSAIQAERR
ncbi:antitoxin [Branchiibius sp. NY16-3462-2]|uniref:FitA-like ribbon-helix-helix domain-containing protein n=1 Tax=Branchiibius sp. NY16-3462-2 TaxID=1807500 RepID=UPI0007979F79|nr:antitoxin [Branchiibius sp. NY16-3462-2]KYH44255.1 antitoxin [Branchiibius sp. NY16-3462-2]